MADKSSIPAPPSRHTIPALPQRSLESTIPTSPGGRKAMLGENHRAATQVLPPTDNSNSAAGKLPVGVNIIKGPNNVKVVPPPKLGIPGQLQPNSPTQKLWKSDTVNFPAVKPTEKALAQPFPSVAHCDKILENLENSIIPSLTQMDDRPHMIHPKTIAVISAESRSLAPKESGNSLQKRIPPLRVETFDISSDSPSNVSGLVETKRSPLSPLQHGAGSSSTSLATPNSQSSAPKSPSTMSLQKLATLSRESRKTSMDLSGRHSGHISTQTSQKLASTKVSPASPASPSGSQNQLGNGYGMFCEPWKRERIIGQGQFGTVFLGRNLRTGERMAVKQVLIRSVDMLEQMIDEVVLNCRASFRNQNVVMCMGWSVTDACEQSSIREEEKFGMDIHTLDGLDKLKAVNQNFNIFMEYVERGSISSLLEKNGAMPEPTVRNYMRQLLLGVRSLHAAGIAHRDIKCQNLLLTSENVLKVADFGSAKRLANQTLGPNSSIQGSIPWMSPEVIRQEVGRGDDEASKLTGWKYADIWSIGCTMIEMFTGRPPWNNYSNPAAMMFAIAGSKASPKMPDSVSIHSDGLNFLSQCCNLEPFQRPAVAKLIYHPYMRTENVDANGNYMPKAAQLSVAAHSDDEDEG